MVVRRTLRASEAGRADVIDELQRLLSSERFRRSPSLSRLLSYIVERSLAGESEDLKEYTVGVEVFDRTESFDPRIDTIVRVQARRLRQRLKEHYAGPGADSHLRIMVPKGAYAPTFEIAAEPEALPASPEAPAPPERPKRNSLGRALAIAAGATLCLAAAAPSVLRVFRAPSPPEAAKLVAANPTPLTTYNGYENEPALSPDGKQIAFVWAGENGENEDVYVRAVEGGSPIRLTRHPAQERHPAWSPDSRSIAFLRPDDDGASLIIAALAAPTSERVVARTRISRHGPSYGLAWSRDGRFLAAQNLDSDDKTRGIFLFSVETGEGFRATSPGAGYLQDRWPSFAPDSRSLAFARGGTSHALCMVALREDGRPSGPVAVLQPEKFYIRGVSWAPSGRSVVFAGVSGASRMQIHSVDTRTRELTTLIGGHGGELPTTARRYPDSALQLAYVAELQGMDLYRIEARPNRLDTTERIPRRIASSTRSEHSPRFSADGMKIALVSQRSGFSELWVANSDGSSPYRLSDFRGRSTAAVRSPRWSPDGKTIVFAVALDGNHDLYLVAADGGEARRLTDSPANQVRGSFSRDGKWLYYSSDEEGTPQIWKTPVAGGQAFRLTEDTGLDAFESADGKWVYFAKRYGQSGTDGIFRLPSQGGPEERVLDRGAVGRWALSDSGIYLLNADDRRRAPTIEYYPHDTRIGRTIIEFPKGARFGTSDSLTVTPDDRWLTVAQVDDAGADLMIAEAGN